MWKDWAEWHNWQKSQSNSQQQTRNRLGHQGGRIIFSGRPKFYIDSMYENNGYAYNMTNSDVVEIVTFETENWLKFRDETEMSSKTPRLETCSSIPRPRLETSKFRHFAKRFFKKCHHHVWLKFFQISGIFPSCFGCFLPANTTNKKSLNYRNFNQPCRWIVFAILEVSRPQLFETETRPETFETKTRKNVSRDESRDRDQVSRQVLFKRFCYGAPLKMFWLTHAPSLHSCIPFTDTSPVSPT